MSELQPLLEILKSSPFLMLALQLTRNAHSRILPLCFLLNGRSGEPSIVRHCTHLFTIEHSQIRAQAIILPRRPTLVHPSRPPSTHPAHQHREHSPSPVPSSPSSGFTQPHAHQHRQGIAPQPMHFNCQGSRATTHTQTCHHTRSPSWPTKWHT